MNEMVRLFKMSAKVPLLKDITIEEDAFVFSYGSTKNDLMYVYLSASGVSKVLFPRNLFPRFAGAYTESNIQNSRDQQMLKTFALLYDENFFKKLAKIISSNNQQSQ